MGDCVHKSVTALGSCIVCGERVKPVAPPPPRGLPKHGPSQQVQEAVAKARAAAEEKEKEA